jgi:hypothetical protein
MTTMLTERPGRPAAAPEPQIDPETLHHVRKEVKDILERSSAFAALDADQQREVAHGMVKVAAYLADGGEGAGKQTAQALADVPQVGFDPGETAGQRFGRGGAVAAQQGTQVLTDAVSKVNFPKFVADLVSGTFGAIVTSSIKQMDAYMDLIKNVSKSVDDFMKDNVSPNNARDYLAQRYPDHLAVDTSGGTPKLAPKDGADEDAMPDFMKDLGLHAPVDSLDDETVEKQLVPAARQRMALDRQHLLATMVLMGINRLVVTDGDIEAKVLFQLDTQDKVTSNASQNQNFSDTDVKTKGSSGFLWFAPSTDETETTNFTVATTKSDASADTVKLHTDLSGKVSIHFKSETFPLDKMADIIGVDKIGDQQVGTGASAAAPAPAGTPPALPPPLPGTPSIGATPSRA